MVFHSIVLGALLLFGLLSGAQGSDASGKGVSIKSAVSSALTPEMYHRADGQTGNTVPEARYAQLNKCFNLTDWFQVFADGVGWGAVSDSEMKLMRQNGITAVRLPFNPWLFDSSRRSPAAINATLENLDNAIDLLIANNLTVVLDAHDTNGGVSLDSEAAIVRFIQTWSMLAMRYANRNPDTLLFEVMNEPGETFPTASWSTIQNRVLDAIRTVAPQHTIVVTSNSSSFRSIIGMPLVADSNVIYTAHFYDPMLFTHQGADWVSSTPWLVAFSGLDYPPYMPAVRTKLAASSDPAYSAIKGYQASHQDSASVLRAFDIVGGWSTRNGVRLWLGEFGAHLWPSSQQTSPPIPVDARMRWLKDARIAAEANGIGWCMWNFKGNFGYINTLNGAYAPEVRVLTALGLVTGSVNEAPVSPYAFSTTIPVYFDAAVATAEPTPSNANADTMVVTDLTGDGNLDAVVTNIDWPQTSVERPIQLLINNGDGSFRSGNGLIAGTIPQVRRISRIITADFNRSGRNGLLFLEQGFSLAGGQNKLLLYNGNDQYIDATGNLPQQIAQSIDADTADLRGNGFDLIVFNDWANGTVNRKPMQLWINDGAGRFTLDQSRLPADLLGNHIFTSGKFIDASNGIKDKDLVVFGNQSESSNWYLKNDGSGHFSKGVALPAKPFKNYAYATSVVSDDLNGDGLPDLIVAYLNGVNFTDSALQVLINNGNGTFRDETSTRMPESVYTSLSVRDLYLAPFAQTGNKDLLIKFSGNAPVLKLNNGGIFGNAGENDLPVQDSWLITPADLDRDGATDLLLGSSVGEAHAVFGKKWFDPLAPQGYPTISSATVGNGIVTINFSTISTFGGIPVTSYSATCKASGLASKTANGSGSPITVKGLAGNVAYQCYVLASSGGYTSASSAVISVIPNFARKSSLGPLLLLLLD